MHPPPQAHTDLQPMHMCKYSHDTVRAEGQPACTQLLTGNEETTTQRLRPTDTPSTVHIIIVTKIKNVQMRGDAGTSGTHRADEQKNGTRFNVRLREVSSGGVFSAPHLRFPLSVLCACYLVFTVDLVVIRARSPLCSQQPVL